MVDDATIAGRDPVAILRGAFQPLKAAGRAIRESAERGALGKLNDAQQKAVNAIQKNLDELEKHIPMGMPALPTISDLVSGLEMNLAIFGRDFGITRKTDAGEVRKGSGALSMPKFEVPKSFEFTVQDAEGYDRFLKLGPANDLTLRLMEETRAGRKISAALIANEAGEERWQFDVRDRAEGPVMKTFIYDPENRSFVQKT